jgi:hypothetical protein
MMPRSQLADNHAAAPPHFHPLSLQRACGPQANHPTGENNGGEDQCGKRCPENETDPSSVRAYLVCSNDE